MEEKETKWYIINIQLLKVKAFYFLTFAAVGCLFPYLTLYLKNVGFSSSQTGVIFGLMPFLAFLLQPAIGVIADKYQRHKFLVVLFCVLTGLFFNLVTIVQLSFGSVAEVQAFNSCENVRTYSRVLHKGEHCSFTSNSTLPLSVKSNLSSQGSHYIHSKKILSCNYICNIESGIIDECSFNTSEVYWNTNCKCYINESEIVTVTNPKSSLSSKWEISSDSRLSACARNFNSCIDKYVESQNHSHHERIEDVMLRCCYKEECNESTYVKINNKSFWLILLLFLLGHMSYAPISSLTDAISYDYLGKENRRKWGKQRLWGNVSLAVFAVVSAFIIDESEMNNISRFSIAFYMYGITFLIMAFALWKMKISNALKCKNMIKGAVVIMKQTKTLTFLPMIAYFGLLARGIEAFLFWFLEAELKNQLKLIPGLCMVSNCVSEIIVFHFSGNLIKRIGHFKCLYIVCIAYTIRFTSYSFLENAWLVLPIELLNGITFSLMWTTATSYGSIICPQGMSGSIQGLLSGIYFGFGKGIGGILTGLLYTRIGIRWTFRLYGIATFGIMCTWFLVNQCTHKTNTTSEENSIKDSFQCQTDLLEDSNFKKISEVFNVTEKVAQYENENEQEV